MQSVVAPIDHVTNVLSYFAFKCTLIFNQNLFSFILAHRVIHRFLILKLKFHFFKVWRREKERKK